MQFQNDVLFNRDRARTTFDRTRDPSSSSEPWIWGEDGGVFGVVPALIHCGRLTTDAATEMACPLDYARGSDYRYGTWSVANYPDD